MYILAGMGQKPFRKVLLKSLEEVNYPPAKSNNLEKLYDDFKADVNDLDTYVKTLPSSYEFLKKHIYT